MTFLQLSVQGLALGAIYGLIALPISLVWRATGMLDIGIGGYAVVAGMILATAGGLTGGIFLGLAAGLVGSALTACIILVLRARGQTDPITGVVATTGVLFGAESFAQWAFGAAPVFRRLWASPLNMGGIVVRPEALLNLFVALVMLLAMMWVLYRTPLGRVMRAVSTNPDDAALVGIAVWRVQFGVVVLGGVLAALAGLLVVASVGLQSSSGLPLTIFAVGAVIVLGMRGPAAALGGGLVLGLVGAFAAGYTPATVGPIITMVFVFVVLASGIFDFEEASTRA